MDQERTSSTGPRPSASLTNCPYCGGAVVSGLPFCPSCGKRLRSPTAGPPCPRCGTGVPEGRYCPACGLDMERPVPGAAAGGRPSAGYALSLIDESGSVVGRYPLAAGETTIGREGAALEFPDDVFMSPLHAKISVGDGSVTIRDLGSRNGTWVFISGPHLLVDGDRLLIGSQILEYRRLGYPGPHPPERDARAERRHREPDAAPGGRIGAGRDPSIARTQPPARPGRG